MNDVIELLNIKRTSFDRNGLEIIDQIVHDLSSYIQNKALLEMLNEQPHTNHSESYCFKK